MSAPEPSSSETPSSRTGHDAVIAKLATGIPGVDLVTHGGLPAGRATLVTGTSGSAKTVFALQFLAAGAGAGEPGVFVSLEERPDDIRANAKAIGFDVEALEADDRFVFVDASPATEVESVVAGEYDLGALLARVEHAVQRVGARRVAVDSVGALFSQVPHMEVVRRDLFRLVGSLRRLGVTAVLTAERDAEYGASARYGVEDFVADNVVILRNVLDDGQRRRSIEVLKLRGTSHQRGEYPFSVIDGEGIVVLPLTAITSHRRSTDERISTGLPALDALTDGGFFRDSMVLVSGPTGAGKTLTATHFAAGGLGAGERVLVFSFEETAEQLRRNARGWGVDYETAEAAGLLKVFAAFPESAGLEDHLIRMKGLIDTFRPQRITVDSLSALERGATAKAFREFVIGLSAYIKQQEIAGLFTVTTSDLSGGTTITDSHISTITDAVLLLRYVETDTEIRRALTVLKMRGSSHNKQVREFVIGSAGMVIGEPFPRIHGFLSSDLTSSYGGDGG
ncbi:MAG TPA: circadian clock protein KaiC [Acidimicrobiales bacterium]|nr:circadian clock protein KaiC [Acidimicrobiales bacterium]